MERVTYWPEIAGLEARIASGDPAPLIEFIQLLGERGLLDAGMLHGLIDTSADNQAIRKRWSGLHEMAAKGVKVVNL